MTRDYTPEEMQVLSEFEMDFLAATRASWCRNPGNKALGRILEIHRAATGDQRRENWGCGNCILHLMQDVGAKYLAQKEAANAKQPQKPGGNTTHKAKGKNKTI